MADLDKKNSASTTKIVGADSSGTETVFIGNVDDSLKFKGTNADIDPQVIRPQIQSIDAIGRYRVSNPKVLAESSYAQTNKTLRFSDVTTTGGTVTRNSTKRAMELAVTTASGSRALRQTKEYIPYIPGQSFTIIQTAVFAAGTANCVQRIGYFDDNNGLFFQKTNTTFQVVVRDDSTGSVVNTTIDQSSFNLDTMDGTGPSGVTLDTTKDNAYIIDFLWLGSGSIRFGIVYEGTILYFHKISNENVNTQSYMATATLPVRQEIINTGAISSAQTLTSFCFSVYSEGDTKKSEQIFSTNATPSLKNISSNSWTPLISLRLKSSNIRGQILPNKIAVLSSGNKEVAYAVFINGSLTGASWTSVNANSISEQDTSATAISGGYQIKQFSSLAGIEIDSEFDKTLLKLSADYAGTSDIITIAARAFSGNGDAWGSINFQEIL